MDRLRELGSARTHARLAPDADRTLCGLGVTGDDGSTWLLLNADESVSCETCQAWLNGAAFVVLAEVSAAGRRARD